MEEKAIIVRTAFDNQNLVIRVSFWDRKTNATATVANEGEEFIHG